LDAVIVFKYDIGKFDDPQAALELNWLQTSFVCPGCATTAHMTMGESHQKREKSIQPRTTHLGPFERVDQTAFADVGEANDTDCDAPPRSVCMP